MRGSLTSIKRGVHGFGLAVVTLIGWATLLVPPDASAQSSNDEPAPFVFSQEELDQALAPIALYPDTLLTQVLIAATYPLEVVEAERFVRANSGLKGEALTRAAGNRTWDASVISLLQFPSVLTMMNDDLAWTQRLGDAFLGQQDAVMDTVQSLRARAQQAGNLQTTAQQTVVVQDRVIVIESPRVETVYVPYYNPAIVYGPWWWPARPPWYWVPPPRYRPPGFGTVVVSGVFWGVGIHITRSIWNDYRPSWRDRQINIVNHITIVNRPNRPRPGGAWQHDPHHRKGVAYRDVRVRDRVNATRPGSPGAVRPAVRPTVQPGSGDRRPGRGDDPGLNPRPSISPAVRPGVKPAVRPEARPTPQPNPRPGVRPIERPTTRPAVMPAPRPAPQLRPSPIRPSGSREAVQSQADRGRSSREAIGRPSARPAPRAAPRSSPPTSSRQGNSRQGPSRPSQNGGAR